MRPWECHGIRVEVRRTFFRNQVSPFALWVPGIELTSLARWQAPLPTKPSCWPNIDLYFNASLRLATGLLCPSPVAPERAASILPYRGPHKQILSLCAGY